MVLITVRLAPEATLADAVARLELSDDEVDTGYGLVPLDPAQNLYALRVTEAAARRLGDTADGPYSDPRIEPFGPPC